MFSNDDLNLEFKARRMILNFLVNLVMAVKELPSEDLDLKIVSEYIRNDSKSTILSKLFQKCLLNSFDFYT